MVMQLRSARLHMVLRSGRVVKNSSSLKQKKQKTASKLGRRGARPLVSSPVFRHYAAASPTMVQDFIAVTGATHSQAIITINQALRLGLTLDHAVEYFFTRVY